MRPYEINYLISAETADLEQGEIKDKVISLCQELGAIIDSNSQPALKIPKGSLLSITFKMAPEKIAELEKKLKDEKRILRYLLVIKKKPSLEREFPIFPRTETSAKPKVEMAEIDKKLEEILGK